MQLVVNLPPLKAAWVESLTCEATVSKQDGVY